MCTPQDDTLANAKQFGLMLIKAFKKLNANKLSVGEATEVDLLIANNKCPNAWRTNHLCRTTYGFMLVVPDDMGLTTEILVDIPPYQVYLGYNTDPVEKCSFMDILTERMSEHFLTLSNGHSPNTGCGR